jgi:hypothetical protein
VINAEPLLLINHQQAEIADVDILEKIRWVRSGHRPFLLQAASVFFCSDSGAKRLSRPIRQDNQLRAA